MVFRARQFIHQCLVSSLGDLCHTVMSLGGLYTMLALRPSLPASAVSGREFCRMTSSFSYFFFFHVSFHHALSPIFSLLVFVHENIMIIFKMRVKQLMLSFGCKIYIWYIYFPQGTSVS